jgi:tetratricopeptide (TPR) repeat protein
MMGGRRRRSTLLPLLVVGAVAAAGSAGWFLWSARGNRGPAEAGPPAASASIAAGTARSYIGEPACTKCHESQTKEWRQSDHARAMEIAGPSTVIGDFNGATFAYAGMTSSFSTRDNRYFVRTDGPDGTLHDYEVKYTFGFKPLQQYLIEFPGGRMQCLPIAWDSRPRTEGGQRWFHLYPGERITHTDPLHWTGPNQNWNYMCAECHSTDLRRNYDLSTDSYQTRWSEINVSCETCHGPGSAHATWADERKKNGLTGRDGTAMGLVVPGLRALDYSGFGVGDATSAAARLANRARQQAEIQSCAPCHSRRSPIAVVADPGRSFLDSFRPALLEDGLYYSDGQIREEVYEYASFTQSRMYEAGVTCSDCHNAHSLKQRGTGSNVCAHCHLPLAYDTPTHHHHKQGTEAALCRNCHMPTRLYMVVDPRRDHSMRVPRVDYTAKFGIPNACTTPCHENKSVRWSDNAVVKWYGPVRARGNEYVAALDAARRSAPDAERLLRAAVLNRQFPAMARATALVHLRELLSDTSIDALQAGVSDSDALVRAAAARALEALPEPDRFRLGRPLLGDPIRLVRASAAASLAGTPPELVSSSDSAALDLAVREAVAVESAVAERPEAHLNLSNLYLRLGRAAEAAEELRTALRLDSRSIAARVNLADLYRGQGREADAERILREAIAIEPNAAEAHHALGLLGIRLRRYDEALASLGRAHQLRPDNIRYGYVYAVGLDAVGRTARAVQVLSTLHRARPGDADMLVALATFEEKLGHRSAAIGWAEALVRARPNDAEAKALFNRLR